MIVLIPTYDDKLMCWKRLWTPVEFMTLNSTNIIKLIIVIEAKWIKPPAITFMYSSVYVKFLVKISADEDEKGLLLSKCVKMTKVIGPHKYINLTLVTKFIHWSIVLFAI